jgi:hypothetical protein
MLQPQKAPKASFGHDRQAPARICLVFDDGMVCASHLLLCFFFFVSRPSIQVGMVGRRWARCGRRFTPSWRWPAWTASRGARRTTSSSPASAPTSTRYVFPESLLPLMHLLPQLPSAHGYRLLQCTGLPRLTCFAFVCSAPVHPLSIVCLMTRTRCHSQYTL